MWTITVTVATLVADVSSVELDKYRYRSTAVFLLYAVSRVPLRAESKFSTGTRALIANTTKLYNCNLAACMAARAYCIVISRSNSIATLAGALLWWANYPYFF